MYLLNPKMKKYIILFCLLLIGSLPAASVAISDKSFIKYSTSYKEVQFPFSKYKRTTEGTMLITIDDKTWIDVKKLTVDGYRFDSFEVITSNSIGLHGTQSLIVYLKK